jgi:serine protease AprX
MKNVAGFLLIFVIFVSALGNRQSVQASNDTNYAVITTPIEFDPTVRTSLSGLQPDEMLTVIVTLRQQADLSRVQGADRAARLQGVIRALQATASATQGPLTNLLNAWISQGLVQSFESFWVFNGFSVTGTSAVINALAQQPDVLSIALDDIQVVPAAGTPESNMSVVNAPSLWDQGIFGQGIVVANMDTGVDISHPDLVDRWRGGNNSWFDPYGQHPDTPTDLSGHGTWTMGIMVGGDAGGASIGVAPEAQWIAVKIFNDRGRSTSTAIHKGFQWLLDPDGNPNTPDAPQVVNNSWTYANPGCYLNFEPDLQALRAAGILPVFAAGNGGPGNNSSYSPSNNPSAFAVGATDNNDQIYVYSSRGPSTCGGSTGPFPEVVAPGVNIRTTGLFGTYYTDSGTSLAAPHVAGGLALLLSAYPDLAAADQEGAMINSAVDLGASGPDDVYGYGRIDLLSAYNWLATAPTSTPAPSATPTSTLTPTPTPLPTATPTPMPAATMHVGDLDGSSALSKPKWDATVTIRIDDTNEDPVANAIVSGVWSSGPPGTDSCITNASGVCQITRTGLNSKSTSVTFTVSNVTQASLSYESSANHDPDGDSDGTSLTISKP